MSQAQLEKLLTIFEKMPTLGSLSLEQERANLDEGGARFLVLCHWFNKKPSLLDAKHIPSRWR